MCHPVFPGSLITPVLVKVEQRLLCSHNLLEGPQAECLCCCSRAVLWHLGTQPLGCPTCPHSPSAAQGTALAQHTFLAMEQKAFPKLQNNIFPHPRSQSGVQASLCLPEPGTGQAPRGVGDLWAQKDNVSATCQDCS